MSLLLVFGESFAQADGSAGHTDDPTSSAAARDACVGASVYIAVAAHTLGDDDLVGGKALTCWGPRNAAQLPKLTPAGAIGDDVIEADQPKLDAAV